MAKRRFLSPMRRLKILEAADMRCHLCGQKIKAGEHWEAEHVRALALGGADDASNMKPAHVACHAVKTRADAASWSKAKRMKAKHVGIRKRSSFPCSRDGKFKKKVGGKVVLRQDSN